MQMGTKNNNNIINTIEILSKQKINDCVDLNNINQQKFNPGMSKKSGSSRKI